MLGDVPYLDFDTSFTWTGACYFMMFFVCSLTPSPDWSFPDQLVFSITRSLLKIAQNYPEFHTDIMKCIMAFVSSLGNTLNTGEGTAPMSSSLGSNDS